MTKVLEDIINQIFADVEDKISQGIKEIDQFFQAEQSKITAPQAEEFVTKYQQLYSEVKQAPLLSLKLKAYQEFNSYVNQINTQYHEALQNPVIRGMEQIDSHIQALNYLIKAELLILTAFSSYHLNYLELDEYKKFHQGLEYLQKFVDTYGCYLADSFLKNHLIEAIESIIASNIFDDSIIKNNSVDDTAKEVVKKYIHLINNYAKDVLLSIYRLKPRSFPKKFKTIDELWDYWDTLYTDEEMKESLEILQKGLDEERRRQGGRTLFS